MAIGTRPPSTSLALVVVVEKNKFADSLTVSVSGRPVGQTA